MVFAHRTQRQQLRHRRHRDDAGLFALDAGQADGAGDALDQRLRQSALGEAADEAAALGAAADQAQEAEVAAPQDGFADVQVRIRAVGEYEVIRAGRGEAHKKRS